jgi:hypothetical protein
MPRKAVVDKQTGIILNVIIADDDFAENLPVDVELVDAPHFCGMEIGNIVDLNQNETIVTDVNSDEKIADVINKNVNIDTLKANLKNVFNGKEIKIVRHPKVINDYTKDDYNTYIQQVQLALTKLNEVMMKPPRKFVKPPRPEQSRTPEQSQNPRQ